MVIALDTVTVPDVPPPIADNTVAAIDAVASSLTVTAPVKAASAVSVTVPANASANTAAVELNVTVLAGTFIVALVPLLIVCNSAGVGFIPVIVTVPVIASPDVTSCSGNPKA